MFDWSLDDMTLNDSKIQSKKTRQKDREAHGIESRYTESSERDSFPFQFHISGFSSFILFFIFLIFFLYNYMPTIILK